MKNWITLLLLLPFCYTAFSQEKFFEEPIGWHGKSIEVHTISDRDKLKTSIFLCKDDSVRVFVLDNNQTVIQHFFINRQTDEQFLGGFIKDNKVYAFFQTSGANSDLHVWTLTIADGLGDDYIVPFSMHHEKAVDQISCGDHFLYFTANKRASEFAIYDFYPDKRCDTLRYQFDPAIWRALTTLNGGWSREMNVTAIDPDGYSNPDIAHVPNKLYWRQDTLLLLMNNYERGVTSVYTFDMIGKKVDLRKITHNNAAGMDKYTFDYTDNSMLLDDKLYFVSAESGKLNIQIRDFYSGKLLHEYNTARNDEIDYKNTPIIQEGSFYKSGPRELAKTRQLLNKMTSGSSVMIANHDDSGHIALTVGAWEKMKSSGGFGVGFVAGSIAGATMFFVQTGMYFRNSRVRSSRFKMLVDTTTLQHVPGDIPGDIGDRIEHYTDGISIPPEGETLFRNNGKYVYAYYNRDEHKLMLINF